MKRTVKRRSRWQRSPGWQLEGLGTAALLALAGASLWLPGWVLGHVSDLIGAVR